MKLISADRMRELDGRAVKEHGISGDILMERAGRGVADVVRRLAREAGCNGDRVLFVAGPGNNGGDAFAAARCLRERGFRPDARLAGSLADVKGDALRHLNRMVSLGICPCEWSDERDWETAGSDAGEWGIVVDGILGTGIRGRVRGVPAVAIRWVNRIGVRVPVVAIDVPSGLDADSGEACGEAVRADVTVTMGLPKRGLVRPAAGEYVGAIEVVDIGLPPELTRDLASDLELITREDVRTFFQRRRWNAHKGEFGHVLILSGAAGFSGAVAVAAAAAVRSGAGLVTAVVPAGIAAVVAGAVPEAMVHPGDETDEGSLAASAWTPWESKASRFSALLLGPGMTPHEQTKALVSRVLAATRVPVVLDADALNVFQNRVGEIAKASGPVVITPHPGEMARLMGGGVRDIQEDRVKTAVAAAEQTGAVVVLKGAGTIVAGPGRVPAINMTGNPGMATGGMGDALSGLLAGLLAQGLEPFAAASAAVFLHGRAADVAVRRGCQAALAATDMIRAFPPALAEVMPR